MVGGAVRVLGAVRGVVWVVRVRGGGGVRTRIGSLFLRSKHVQKPPKVLEAV